MTLDEAALSEQNLLLHGRHGIFKFVCCHCVSSATVQRGHGQVCARKYSPRQHTCMLSLPVCRAAIVAAIC